LALLSLVGVFFKNKITWVFVQALLYYFFVFSIYDVLKHYDDGKYYVLGSTLIALVLVLLLYVNAIKNYKFYTIERSKLLGLNTISFVIGMFYLYFLKFINL
jgi:hypothetical protein